MNPKDTEGQEQAANLPYAASAQVPHSATTTMAASLNTQEDERFINVPYAAAQATPSASGKQASTLPPIAMAQPLGKNMQNQPHSQSGSNIPPRNYQNGLGGANLSHHLVTVVPIAPLGDDAEDDNMRFKYLQKNRWMAILMMTYYAMTFLILQPIFLGVMGLLTAFAGQHGSRAPVNVTRFNWLRHYMWANYVILILNIWLLVVTLVFSGSVFGVAKNKSNESTDTTFSFTSSKELFIGLLVAANTLIHLRCLRTVQLLIAELINAGRDRPAPVASAVPTSTE